MTSPVPAPELDLTAGVFVRGLALDEHTFLASSTFAQLRQITRNPVELAGASTQSGGYDPDLEEERALHEMVQRALAGSKKTNVARYAHYIAQRQRGQAPGVLPPIHLWTKETLEEVDAGAHTYVMVPIGERLIALDGETQLTAHYALDTDRSGQYEDIKAAHRKAQLGVVLHHGISVNTARQYFHDLNILAVRPNTSLGLAMDTQDPIIRVLEAVERRTPPLIGKIDKAARQLPKRSLKLVTLQNLRQMVINIGTGISGVQYGSRPAPVEEMDLQLVEDLAVQTTNWLFDRLRVQVVDREGHLLISGAVFAALGALVHDRAVRGATTAAERQQSMEALFADLETVDWRKGDHWRDIAGNWTERGAFSVKGTKEVAYTVYNALKDPHSRAGQRIRGRDGQAPSSDADRRWIDQPLDEELATPRRGSLTGDR
jgi:hypothetical protein